MQRSLSEFSSVVARHITKASLVYEHTPFSDMYPQRRGLLLEDIGREMDANETIAPIKKHKRSRASYDWLRKRDNIRVECKSAQLSWNKSGWVVHFKNIKVCEFDVLVLCLYTPTSLEYFECNVSDLTTLYSQGRLMPSGQCLVLRAGKCHWTAAAAAICRQLATIGTKTGCVKLL